MIDFIVNYPCLNGQGARDQEELRHLKKGISLYLLENGINENDTREYFKKYVSKHLAIIDKNDLREYFLHYHTISAVSFTKNGKISSGDIIQLRVYVKELCRCGLRSKYIPTAEVSEMLNEVL